MRRKRSSRPGPPPGREAPHDKREIRINDEFTGTVRDVSAAGSGVVEHPSGRVFFIPGVWTGEQGRFRVTGLKGRFGHARVEHLIAVSPHRVTPDCPHHGAGAGDCGGCPWQFIDYAAQRSMKEARVRAAMAPLGVSGVVHPLWPSPHTYGYRNRAQFKTDGHQLGYVAAGSNTLVAISDCPILTTPNRNTLQALLRQLPEPAWKLPRKHIWTSLDIDEQISAETVVPNQRRPFRQGNTAQNLRMQEWLAAALEPLDRSHAVVELFCGNGNFTAVLAEMGFSDITATDSAEDAIATLTARNLPGVTAAAHNLYAEDAYEKLRIQLKQAHILVLDPPRDGLKHIDPLLRHARRLRHVFYISCDLATFTRDTSRLLDAGFSLKTLQPLDQFPHTPHIELLAHLAR
ncbi:MAG: class I SAM-dependent RNA methyltransferase [Chromatocurvus sp.]